MATNVANKTIIEVRTLKSVDIFLFFLQVPSNYDTEIVFAYFLNNQNSDFVLISIFKIHINILVLIVQGDKANLVHQMYLFY